MPPRPIHRVVIEVHDNGGLTIDHPTDVILTFGMLEAAKANIIATILKQNQDMENRSKIHVVPANAVPKIEG